MEMCNEMIKLRKGLDERGIVWIDASEIENNSVAVAASLLFDIDRSIYRTYFTAHGVGFSVIYGYGTYGNESGLLECMSKAVDENGEPKGSMTADEILEIIDELKNDVEDALKSIIDAPITKAEPIKHGRWIKRMARIYACSDCTQEVTDKQAKAYDFCPYCGARMDGDEE